MEHGDLIRVFVMNFITSLIIAVITCDILYSFRLYGGMYLGNLFGLYFLVIYGVNNIIEAEKIPNNYLRFVLVIIEIILFDIAFLFVIPLIFGANAFPATEYLSINYNGVLFNAALTKEFYLALFAVAMLLCNYLMYRRHQYYHEYY